MRRTNTAVASDKDWEGKTLLRQWDRCEKVDHIFMVEFLLDCFYEMPGATKQNRSALFLSNVGVSQ